MKNVLLVLLFTLGSTAFAVDSAELDDAVHATQQAMKDPNQRQQMLKGEEAQKVHQNAEKTVGRENVDAMYDLSADLIPELIAKAHGDPAELQIQLQQAARNPAAWLQGLSPEFQNRIKGLAEKAEKHESQQTMAPHP